MFLSSAGKNAVRYLFLGLQKRVSVSLSFSRRSCRLISSRTPRKERQQEGTSAGGLSVFCSALPVLGGGERIMHGASLVLRCTVTASSSDHFISAASLPLSIFPSFSQSLPSPAGRPPLKMDRSLSECSMLFLTYVPPSSSPAARHVPSPSCA